MTTAFRSFYRRIVDVAGNFNIYLVFLLWNFSRFLKTPGGQCDNSYGNLKTRNRIVQSLTSTVGIISGEISYSRHVLKEPTKYHNDNSTRKI